MLRVEESADSFFPVEETVNLGSRWASVTSRSEPPG